MRLYSNARYALVLAGFVVLSTAALAQQLPPQNEPVTPTPPTPLSTPSQPEQVTVTAPREVTRTRVGRSRIGAPIEDITISEPVAFNDLNLKNPSDVEQLNQRVRDAAADGCDEIDRLYPLTRSVDTRRDCIRRAVRSASAQVDAAVAAARGYGGSGP